MSRTTVFIAFVALAAVGVVGALILSLHRPDAVGGFVALFGTVLASVATFAATAHGLGRVAEKVEAVRKQTNGTLSAKDEQIAVLQAEKADLIAQLAARRRPFWRRIRRA